jgi:serine/threonine-protein kinase RsbW
MSEPNTGAPAAETMAYHTADHLPAVRAFAQSKAERLGLTPDQAVSLVIAVSELVTNTLQHTSGGGAVRIWAEGDQFACDVIDGGPLRSFGRQMPAADADRGRGLAIVERLCGQVSAVTSLEGTVVRLRFTLAKG